MRSRSMRNLDFIRVIEFGNLETLTLIYATLIMQSDTWEKIGVMIVKYGFKETHEKTI